MSTAYDHGNPSNAEQYLVELINRARSDPAAEAARYGIDLNEGLRPGTLSPAPRAPLPFNPNLIKAAAEHTEWLLPQHPFPSHPHIGKDDKTLPERIKAANYAFDFTDAE